MPSVVFVCTANICRSPVAEALFRDWLRQRPEAGQGEWQVSSAGTWANSGLPATDETCELLAEAGLDLSSHRSRRVDRQMVETADLLLCMTRSQREALQVEFPDRAGRIQMLSAMAGPEFDVADPYGGPRQEYADMIAEVKHLVETGGPRILALAGPPHKVVLPKTAPLKRSRPDTL
jgi:protein-tyrosine-phosphatase